MDNGNRLDNARTAVHRLNAGGIFSTIGGRGTVVRCLQGQAWVTREGDAQDYFLAANTRFQSSCDGVIVVNALVDGTQVEVSQSAQTPKGDWLRNGVRLESGFVEAARREARLARARFVAALFSRAWRGARRGLQLLAALVSRGAFSMRSRRSYHQ